jgi:hypothetical protein
MTRRSKEGGGTCTGRGNWSTVLLEFFLSWGAPLPLPSGLVPLTLLKAERWAAREVTFAQGHHDWPPSKPRLLLFMRWAPL